MSKKEKINERKKEKLVKDKENKNKDRQKKQIKYII